MTKRSNRVLSFIYSALECKYNLHSTENDPPSVPSLRASGFVRWITTYILIDPDESYSCLQNALRVWNVRDDSGNLIPERIPRTAFPSQPDPEMSTWRRRIIQYLDDRNWRPEHAAFESFRPPYQGESNSPYRSRLDFHQDLSPSSSGASSSSAPSGGDSTSTSSQGSFVERPESSRHHHRSPTRQSSRLYSVSPQPRSSSSKSSDYRYDTRRESSYRQRRPSPERHAYTMSPTTSHSRDLERPYPPHSRSPYRSGTSSRRGIRDMILQDPSRFEVPSRRPSRRRVNDDSLGRYRYTQRSPGSILDRYESERFSGDAYESNYRRRELYFKSGYFD